MASLSRLRIKGLVVWLQILLPSFLGLFLLSVLTSIVYSGGRRENLAAKAEAYLIERSLRAAQYSPVKRGEVVTISLTDSDMIGLRGAPRDELIDAHIDVYAEVVRRILKLGPRLLIVSWLNNAHPSNMEYLQPLFVEVDKSDSKDRVFIAFPFPFFSSVPDYYLKHFKIKDAPDCVYEINSFCTYNRDWKDWMIQSIADELWTTIPPWAISTNLPHAMTSFIANFPEPTKIPNFSFSNILSGNYLEQSFKGRVVAIGNDTSQLHTFRDNKDLLQRGYIAASQRKRSLLEDGTPYHIFWAQLAQMFIDERAVNVMPRAAGIIMVIVIGILIWLALVKIGPGTSFAIFLIYSVTLPVLNDYNIRYLRFYLPMFDLIYGGLLIFLVAAFTFISLNTFNKWRFQAKQSIYQSTADLKSNFISLISHNLNTPIAKLSGLLEILLARRDHPSGESILQTCNQIIGKMQICVKSVLLTSAMDQGNTTVATTTIRNLVNDFEDRSLSAIRKLRLDCHPIQPIDELSAAQFFQPINIDARLIAHALTTLMAAFESNHAQTLQARLQLSGDHGSVFLAIDVSGISYLDSKSRFGHLSSQATTRSRQAGNDEIDFFSDVLVTYIRSLLRLSRGSIEVLDPETTATLRIILPIAGTV